MHRGHAENSSSRLAEFRTVGTVVSTCLHRLDRLGQTGRDEGETPSRSAHPVGVGQEARFEMSLSLTTQSCRLATQLYLTSTSPMRFTALQANTRLPSAVAIMLRTTPPPDGINHV